MANLYPVFAVPNPAQTETETRQQYKPSAFFNFETGDFQMDSNGRMVEANGIESWAQWCMKAVYTQRDAFLSYTGGYGAESEEAFSQPTREEQQAYFERTISEAIFADPYNRTLYVRNFSFSWQDDGVAITFDIVGQDTSFPLTLKVNL